MLVAIAISFLALEAGVRVSAFGWNALVSPLRYDPRGLLSSGFVETVSEKKLGWRLKPAQSGHYKGRAFSTNAQGFRDRERSLAPRPGVPRLAVLGRSYEMGTGVADGEAWPAVLEREVLGGKAEVLNFSVEAYNLIQVETTYHRQAKNYAPAWVLIPIYYEEIDTLVPVEAPSLPGWSARLLSASLWLDHVYTPRWIQFLFWRHLFSRLRTDWEYLPSPGVGGGALVTVEPYIQVMQRFLPAIAAHGRKVALLPMPRLIKTDAALYAKGKRLVEVYAHRKPWLAVLTELESVQQEVTDRDMALPGDPHFGAAVHQKLAERVHAGLLRAGFEP